MIIDLFPVRVLVEDFDCDDDIHHELIKLCKRYKNWKDFSLSSSESAKLVTGDKDKSQYPSFFHRLPQAKSINKRVLSLADKYLSSIGAASSIYQVFIQKSWPVFIQPGANISIHSHPNACLSGVYYLDVCSNSDKINFCRDSKHEEELISLRSKGESDFEINVRNGRFVLFPSHLKHYVSRTSSDKTRISVSYDLTVTLRPSNRQSFDGEMQISHPSCWYSENK